MPTSPNLGKSLQNAKLLIVDDDLLSIKLVQVIFANEGCELLTVASAAEALRVIPTFQPDILLLDVVLPFMSGLDLTRMLKAREETRSLVVVVVTASNGPNAERLAREAGCAAYFRKPIDPLTFAQQVAEVWEKERDARADGRNA